MGSWRETCDEVIEAKEREDRQPWYTKFPSYNILATNNADRLARFAKELALELDAFAEQLAGKGAIPMVWDTVDRLWEESK